MREEKVICDQCGKECQSGEYRSISVGDAWESQNKYEFCKDCLVQIMAKIRAILPEKK